MDFKQYSTDLNARLRSICDVVESIFRKPEKIKDLNKTHHPHSQEKGFPPVVLSWKRSRKDLTTNNLLSMSDKVIFTKYVLQALFA
ncbi:unnamed protein product [Sphenostylis stenocarpa]|uniref:Uncharacterized protein n=1 Tax=Sphenostylis stenocarpa TaxID=92480 RepID=A0AA86RTY2_9FABA|nr:unnamed protein product [Sphenostylis stenocarpa]